MTTTPTTESIYTHYDTGRDLDWPSLLEQIGRMNCLSISGGRVLKAGKSAVILPVATGYSVRIILTAGDDYTVQRLFTRNGKSWLHGERSGVYADEIGQVAYYASCYVSYDAEEWMTQS